MYVCAAASAAGRPRHKVLLALPVGGKAGARHGSKLKASGWQS